MIHSILSSSVVNSTSCNNYHCNPSSNCSCHNNRFHSAVLFAVHSFIFIQTNTSTMTSRFSLLCITILCSRFILLFSISHYKKNLLQGLSIAHIQLVSFKTQGKSPQSLHELQTHITSTYPAILSPSRYALLYEKTEVFKFTAYC